MPLISIVAEKNRHFTIVWFTSPRNNEYGSLMKNSDGDNLVNQYLKILSVGLVAWGIAVISSDYLMPQSAIAKTEYAVKYNELENKTKTNSEITKEDIDQLEVLFRALNSEKNIKDDLISIGIKYGIYFLLLIPLIIWAARNINLENNSVIASSGLIFLSFILFNSIVIGGVFAALFFVVAIAFKKTSQ